MLVLLLLLQSVVAVVAVVVAVVAKLLQLLAFCYLFLLLLSTCGSVVTRCCVLEQMISLQFLTCNGAHGTPRHRQQNTIPSNFMLGRFTNNKPSTKETRNNHVTCEI